jgi:WD40-like Beta Propeller Repeat
VRHHRAVRLLEAFGLSEPLIGDLEEEFRRRGSGLWYWRQTLATIAVSMVEDLRARRWRVLAAILAGWAVLLSWAVVWSLPSWRGLAADPAWLADTRYPGVLGVSGSPHSLALLLLTMCLVAMSAAGVAGRIARPGRSGLLLFLLTLPVYSIAACQWMVGQAPQAVLTFGVTHALAMTSAFVAGLWSLPMKENRKGKMPRSLVYGGWALGGLGLGGLALAAALLTGRVELIPVARIPAEALTPGGQSVWVRGMEAETPRPPDEPEIGRIRFSPDGRFLAYVSDGEIHVRALDGGESSRPVWSPDGGWIFYMEDGEIHARSVNGDRIIEPFGPQDPVMSPD